MVFPVHRVTMPPYGAQFRDFYSQSDSHVYKTLAQRMDLVGTAGTLVLGGGAGQQPSPLMTDRITMEEITIRGVNTHDSPAVKQALSIAESGRYPLDEVVTHRFAVEEAGRAIETVAGEIPAEGFIKAVLYPDS